MFHVLVFLMQDYTDLLVLSLGTGQQPAGYDAKEISKWGAVDWLSRKGDSPLVDMVFNASADMVDYNLAIMFQAQNNASNNYLRIQVATHPCDSIPVMFIGIKCSLPSMQFCRYQYQACVGKAVFGSPSLGRGKLQ